MNSKRLFKAFLLAVGVSLGSAAWAAQFMVEDVSNVILTCDGPLLQGKKGCIGFGPNALWVTVGVASGEFELRCLAEAYCWPGYDTYVVAVHRGRYYVYSFNTWPRWQALPEDVAAVPPTVPWRLPLTSFNDKKTRAVYYDSIPFSFHDGYDDYLPAGLPFAELEIYMGVSPVGQKIFTPETFKKIWPKP